MESAVENFNVPVCLYQFLKISDSPQQNFNFKFFNWCTPF